MHHITRTGTCETRSTTLWAGAFLLVVAFLAVLFAGPQFVHAAVSQPPFPRLAAWWPGSAPASDIAKRDYVMLWENDPAHPAQDRSAILAENPNMMFMSEGSARELTYRVDNSSRAYEAERLGAVPRSWVLLQVGSTLTEPVTSLTSATLKVAVASPALFLVGDLVLVDSEYMSVTAVANGAPGILTVKRGMAGSAVAAHAAGVRANAAVSAWPGSVILNMSDSCPSGIATGEFASPAAETASRWMARRNVGFYRSRQYDGIMVDVANEWLYYAFKAADGVGGPIRSIGTVTDPNTPVADYVAFDTTWRTGIRKMFSYMRQAEPTAIIIANGSASNDIVTGGAYEDKAVTTMSLDQWNYRFFGTSPWTKANNTQYKAWIGAPNFTTIVGYSSATDYRSLRFALTTSLMSDGYFAHRGGNSLSPERNVLHWFDEYDGGGLGKGYLGQPAGDATPIGGAWRRDFANGVALVNPTDSPVTVSLGTTFRKIRGTQAPAVNDGTYVASVIIPAKDGIILLRIAPVPAAVVNPTPIISPIVPRIETPAPTVTVALRAAATTLTYGQVTTLRSTLDPASSASVRFESRTAAAPLWVQIATMTADVYGIAQLTVKPLVTTEYRTVLADSGVVSNVATVGVKAITTIRSDKKNVRKASHAVVSGAVSSAGAGTFVMQRRTGHGRWVTIKRLVKSVSGHYRVRVGWSKRGSYSYRVVVAASLSQRGASSRIVRVRVR